MANIVWFALSVPIVTWPAATAGLFGLVRLVVQEELDGAPRETRLGDFWIGFREHGIRSTILTAIDAAAVIAIAVAILFYSQSPAEPLRWLLGPFALIGVVWAGAQIYLYPLLLERTEQSPLQVLREALLTAIAFPPFTLALLVTSLILAIAAGALLGPILFVFFSAMATLQTVALRQLILSRRMSQEESA
ncbi:MAG: DUF624 domain-containing protein [Thermomicrobiales bacterium]